MLLAAISSPDSSLTIFASALPTIGLAVLVAAGRSFPGWDPGPGPRIARAVTLVTALQLLLLAGVGEVVVLDALVHHKSISAGDAQLMRDLVPLGLAAVAVLFLLSTVVPASPAPTVPSPANATLIVTTAVVVAVYSAEPILSAAYEPRSIAVVWITFILFFAAMDWLVAWGAARGQRKLVAKRAQFFSTVAPIEDCAVVTRHGESIVTGWTATATAGVWIADELVPTFARQAQAWSLKGPHTLQALTVRLALWRFDRPRLVVTPVLRKRGTPTLKTVVPAEKAERDAQVTLVSGRTLTGLGLRIERAR